MLDIRAQKTYRIAQPKTYLKRLISCEVAPSGTGILLGYIATIPGRRIQYITLVWKDYKKALENTSVPLNSGCRAAWSLDSTRIITWNTPMDCDDREVNWWPITLYQYSESTERLKTISEEGRAPIWCAFVSNTEQGMPNNLASCMVDVADPGEQLLSSSTQV